MIKHMKDLSLLFILLHLVFVEYAEVCWVKNCEDCINWQKCSVCKIGKFGEECQYDCKANTSTCFQCRVYNTMRAFLLEPICFGCNKYEFFINGECRKCEDTCLTCVNKTLCTQCIDGYYGVNCLQKCPVNCQRCSAHEECSSCEEGWTGTVCQCSTNCVQDGDETNWCGNGGMCLKGCKNGKRGNTCELGCTNNVTCIKCDQLNGQCLQCANGFYEKNNHCETPCGQCQKNGLTECDSDTGECINGCLDGFHGSKCDKQCGRCQKNKPGVLRCAADSGHCNMGCENGYYGSRCDKVCKICKPNGDTACDMETGKCKSGCIDGLFGDDCKNVCVQCLSNDTKNVYKDKVNCTCNSECTDGLYGELCHKKCSDNCLDSKTHSKKCDKLSGKCIGGCRTGIYGDTCDLPCSTRCLNNSCDINSGKCIISCIPGFHGEFCEDECSNGCVKGLCERKTSQCMFGCTDGLNGPFCNETLVRAKSGAEYERNSWDIIVPMVICSCVIVVFIVTVKYGMFFLRYLVRLRRSSRFRLSRTESTIPVYDEVIDDLVVTDNDGFSTLPNRSNNTNRLITSTDIINDPINDIDQIFTTRASANLSHTRDCPSSSTRLCTRHVQNGGHTLDVNDGYEQPVSCLRVNVDFGSRTSRSRLLCDDCLDIQDDMQAKCACHKVSHCSGSHQNLDRIDSMDSQQT